MCLAAKFWKKGGRHSGVGKENAGVVNKLRAVQWRLKIQYWREMIIRRVSMQKTNKSGEGEREVQVFFLEIQILGDLLFLLRVAISFTTGFCLLVHSSLLNPSPYPPLTDLLFVYLLYFAASEGTFAFGELTVGYVCEGRSIDGFVGKIGLDEVRLRVGLQVGQLLKRMRVLAPSFQLDKDIL